MSPQACLDHLNAALGHDLDQAFDFEALQRLADRAEGNSHQFDKFALGNELSRPDIAGEKMLLELQVGRFH